MENKLIYAGYRTFKNLQQANKFMELADAIAPEENNFFIDVINFDHRGTQFYNVHAYLTDEWYGWISIHFDKGQFSLDS